MLNPDPNSRDRDPSYFRSDLKGNSDLDKGMGEREQ